MRRTGAFTLVELLVVVAIIAILASFLFPVFLSARMAVYQMGSGQSVKQLMTATELYQADADDSFPIAMYNSPQGFQTWFGLQTTPSVFDPTQGLLSPYMKGRLGKDQVFDGKPYMGLDTGLGYNYGTIGSDFHLTGDYSGFPNCKNPARATELADSSTTVVFATSVFFSAPWLPTGTGQRYQFGFFDPPSLWHGNPNVDYRFFGKDKVDSVGKEVTPGGHAMMAFADGNVKHVAYGETKDSWFWRNPPGR